MLIAQITDCHVVEPGELVADRVGLRSHLVPVGDYDRWTPSWATATV